MSNRGPHLALALIIAVSLGCDGSQQRVDGGSDASSDARDHDAALDAAPTLSSGCCPIDERLTCDCRQTGGSRLSNGLCPAVCDAVPIVVRRFVDQNGCPAIELSSMSCLDPLDASTGLDGSPTKDNGR
jgi:hypothetical protein